MNRGKGAVEERHRQQTRKKKRKKAKNKRQTTAGCKRDKLATAPAHLAGGLG
jgi:hypothetical protein